MVRIKHRYLLVQILYPSSPTSSTSQLNPSKATPSSTTSQVPRIVQFHRPTSNDLTPQALVKLVRDQIQFLFGDYGVGVVGGGLSGKLISQLMIYPKDILIQLCAILVKYLSPATSTFILRSPRAHHRLVWAALAFITQLPSPKSHSKAKSRLPSEIEKNRECVMRVVRVSGTIRKAESEAIRRARGDIARAKKGETGALRGLEGILGMGDDRNVEDGIEDLDMDEDEDESEIESEE